MARLALKGPYEAPGSRRLPNASPTSFQSLGSSSPVGSYPGLTAMTVTSSLLVRT